MDVASLPETTSDEAGSPPGDRSFRPDVQGLRAVAILVVVAYHAAIPGFGGGYVGVDVFFVISGFVITGLFLRERSKSSKTSLPHFYARRIRRILPMATLVIVTTVSASVWILGRVDGWAVAMSGRWASIFLANYQLTKGGAGYLQVASLSPLQGYWSLAIEEQFYLVFPVLVLAIWALRSQLSQRRRLAIALAVVTISSYGLSILQTRSNPIAAYYSPFTRAWEFALGGLVALAATRLKELDHRVAALLSWFGLALIALATIAFSNATAFPGSLAMIPVLGASLVIAGGSAAPRSGAEVVLGLWPARWIGDRSYSLYLWHLPILVIAADAALTPLSISKRLALVIFAIVLSGFSYWLVENPIRRSRSLIGHHRRTFAVGAVLVLGSFAFCQLMAYATWPARHVVLPLGPRSVSFAQLERELVMGSSLTELPSPVAPPVGTWTEFQPPWMASRCFTNPHTAAGLAQATVPICTFGDPHAARTVVLFGDSQANVFAGAFDTLARSRGWRLVVLSKVSCASTLAPAILNNRPWPACTTFRSYALRQISRLRPEAVVLSSYFKGPAALAGLGPMITKIQATGAKVDVLGTMPWYYGSWSGPDPVLCLGRHTDAVGDCALPVSTLAASFGPLNRSMASIASARHASYTGVWPLFCSASSCPAVAAHRVVYLDKRHMTWVWSTYIGQALGQLLGRSIPGL